MKDTPLGNAYRSELFKNKWVKGLPDSEKPTV